MLTVVAVVAVVVVVATYLTWLAGRLDRLHARTDGARASLDAQLLRRAAAALAIADEVAEEVARTDSPIGPVGRALATASRAASTAGAADRESAENDLSRALHAAIPQVRTREAVGSAHLATLAVACSHVVLARRFYNDAVRDTCSVRNRRLVRVLGLAGHAVAPAYFDIDDTPPAALSALDPAQPT